MILGGASTSLAGDGIATDITPPAILLGSVQIKQDYAETISVPLVSDNLRVVLDITIKQEVYYIYLLYKYYITKSEKCQLHNRCNGTFFGDK